MQENTNWNCEQHPLQHIIIVTTRKFIHPRLDVVGINNIQYIPESVCSRIQAKKSIQRHPICLTDADYYYILYQIER